MHESSLDFTSALYLGMRHPSRAIRPWARLTEGAPAALRESPDSRRVALALARLIGTDGGTLMPSTLHAFWDLFGTLPARAGTVLVDAGTYPVGWWGAERAAGRGAVVRSFRHHDPESLEAATSSGSGAGGTPIVVADGWCPGCGGAAPIRDYLEVVRRHQGLLVLDDTQALGILGSGPSTNPPFGSGGGGSLRWHGVGEDGSDLRAVVPDEPRDREGGRAAAPAEVLVVASLAKGFGVPMTVMAGGRSLLTAFEARSEARIHLSPVSIVHVRAAEHAIGVNARFGASLRRRLGAAIGRFRAGVAGLGLRPSGGMFPVQSIASGQDLEPIELHAELLRRGIRSVVIRSRCRPGPALAFLLTARHTPDDVDATISAIADSLPVARAPRARTIAPGRWQMYRTPRTSRALR